MIPNNFITKIEGHGSLETDWSNGKVKLHIHEGERLFEGMLENRTIEESHWITPRICGVCPIAHNLASLRACEDGLNIKISKTDALLRELMVCSQMMQSHMLHLFFLALPDYLGIDRGTELHQKNPKAFQAALDIKEVSDEIATVVAGRNVHPTRTAIGGFHKTPTREELKKLLEAIKKTRKSAEQALALVKKIEFPELKIDLELVALKDEKIVSNLPTGQAGKIEESAIKDYKAVITEEIRNYSTAKFGRYKGRTIMVGALARLALGANPVRDRKSEISDGSQRDPVSNGVNFRNPFHNNLAQAIEILFYHREAEEVLEKLLKPEIEPKPGFGYSLKPGFGYKGIGAVEAPRGGLYHEIHWDENGIITHADIITPTVQNLTSIEDSANTLLEQHESKSQKEKEKLLEMLVRAYDPCITCSVH